MVKTGFYTLSLTALISVSILLIGCGNSGTDLVYNDGSGVSIRASGSGIFVTNNTPKDIHYFLIEQNAAAYTDWIAGCNDINKIVAGGINEILYADILNYRKECDLLFYWWNCKQAESGGQIPEALKSISLKTK